MKFAEYEKYINELSILEFSERDAQLKKQTLKVKQEMHSRGLQNSSMTKEKISELFLVEYSARSDFLVRFISEGIGRIKFEISDDSASLVKILFQKNSKIQKEAILKHYFEACEKLNATSLSNALGVEIDKFLEDGIENRLVKNNLYLEYNFKSASEVKSGKSIWILTPNFYGVGLDIPALFDRIFK